MEQTRLEIGGMTCGHCVNAVRNALGALDGVQVGEVAIGSADITYDPARVPYGAIVAAVEEEGYQVGPTQLKRAPGGKPAS